MSKSSITEFSCKNLNELEDAPLKEDKILRDNR